MANNKIEYLTFNIAFGIVALLLIFFKIYLRHEALNTWQWHNSFIKEVCRYQWLLLFQFDQPCINQMFLLQRSYKRT